LPKARAVQRRGKDTSLVQVRDLYYRKCLSYGDMCSIDFVVANNGNYVIRNVKLFVVYRNKQGNIVSYTAHTVWLKILPKLAIQSSVSHRVRHCWGVSRPTCTAEIRILDYKIDRSASTSPADLLFK